VTYSPWSYGLHPTIILLMSSVTNITVKKFATNILKLRKIKGMSQEKLAFNAGLDRTYISGIERALRNPSLKNIAKIASALDVPPSKLLE
jgi:DNA-binding XRE family transcriptional regulator